MTNSIFSSAAKFNAAMVIARYVLSTMGTIVASFGWMADSQWQVITGALITGAPAIYGAVKAYRKTLP